MTLRDFATITATALATACLTLAFLSPSAIDAGSDGNAPTPKVETPQLLANGIAVTLADATQPGDAPAFTLTAANLTDDVASVTVETALISTPPPPARGSRMARVPGVLWQERHTWTLGPRETQSVSQATNIKLPENGQTDVMLRTVTGNTVRSGVVALSFLGTSARPAQVQNDGVAVLGRIYMGNQPPANFQRGSLAVEARRVDLPTFSATIGNRGGGIAPIEASAESAWASVTPDGTFELKNLVAGGRYRFSLSEPSAKTGAYLMAIRYGAVDSLANPVQIVDEKTTLQLQIGFTQTASR